MLLQHNPAPRGRLVLLPEHRPEGPAVVQERLGRERFFSRWGGICSPKSSTMTPVLALQRMRMMLLMWVGRPMGLQPQRSCL